jgi:hypothetical protein
MMHLLKTYWFHGVDDVSAYSQTKQEVIDTVLVKYHGQRGAGNKQPTQIYGALVTIVLFRYLLELHSLSLRYKSKEAATDPTKSSDPVASHLINLRYT